MLKDVVISFYITDKVLRNSLWVLITDSCTSTMCGENVTNGVWDKVWPSITDWALPFYASRPDQVNHLCIPITTNCNLLPLAWLITQEISKNATGNSLPHSMLLTCVSAERKVHLMCRHDRIGVHYQVLKGQGEESASYYQLQKSLLGVKCLVVATK